MPPQGTVSLPSHPPLPHKPQLLFHKACQFGLAPESPALTTRPHTQTHVRTLQGGLGDGWPPASPHLAHQEAEARGTQLLQLTKAPTPGLQLSLTQGRAGRGFAPHASHL